jgi:hypothetical protein
MPDPRANLKEAELADNCDFRPGAICQQPPAPSSSESAPDAGIEAMVQKITEEVLRQLKG